MGYALDDGASDVSCGHLVAKCIPRRSTASRMGGDGVANLSRSKIDGDCDGLLSLDGEVNGVGDDEGAIGDNEGWAAVKGDLLDSLGLDGRGTRKAAVG